ncbi:Regulator of RpoS [Vibrio aerogenes CECT 7868]|uniref:Regulator of RpoS n=1 Tax=Vibrio aerogenes CECT 7868 TaxID=1216006 RepID=A0A1M5Z8T6_9VIBR|nr:response regulator [Vibrio aerogenes]SHI20646.1 Regulator of RpoS [Vibrio aerogenes CECT 7868]
MLKTDQSSKRPSAAQPTLDGKLILVVDDDPVFRRLTGGYLISQGCTVCEAGNGVEGLQALKAEAPDLVICDINMPVLNGLEFVEEVCQAYPSLPMIVISATEDISDVAKVLKYGIKDFLPKPIENYAFLGEALVNTLNDSSNYIADQRDFASQWFRVDGGGEMPEEEELHWHLEYLQKNPGAARDLLLALMPDNDSSQGIWRCSYRLLQSADALPLVFDYIWSMNGQYAFYIVDSNSQTCCDGIATSLLVRALFHDYLRNQKCLSADLKDLADILEKGISCTRTASPISAILGIVNVVDGTLSVLPAGMDCHWSNGHCSQHIAGGVELGNNCRKNFITQDLPLGDLTQLSASSIGISSFSLNISRRIRPDI